MFAVLNVIRKPFTRLIAGLAILTMAAACQPVSTVTTGGGGTPTRGAVPVALLVPHGSADAQESQLAHDLENAARLAVSDLSGVQIDLRVYGTAGQAQQAQQAALNAASDGARIIIGPLHAESANAVAVAMAPRNINVLAFSNNPTIAGGNLFILGQTFQNTANRLARYATGQGKSRIMAVYSDNLAGQLGRAAIEQAVRANGATLAGSVGYEFSQQGVLNAVPNIRQSAETNAADAIFLTANSAGCPAALLADAPRERAWPRPGAVYRAQPLGHATANTGIAGRSGRLVRPARPEPLGAVHQPVPGCQRARTASHRGARL